MLYMIMIHGKILLVFSDDNQWDTQNHGKNVEGFCSQSYLVLIWGLKKKRWVQVTKSCDPSWCFLTSLANLANRCLVKFRRYAQTSIQHIAALDHVYILFENKTCECTFVTFFTDSPFWGRSETWIWLQPICPCSMAALAVCAARSIEVHCMHAWCHPWFQGSKQENWNFGSKLKPFGNMWDFLGTICWPLLHSELAQASAWPIDRSAIWMRKMRCRRTLIIALSLDLWV